MGKAIVLDKNGVDITNTVTVINGTKDPLYYRKMADDMFLKVDKFFEKEIFAKRNELTNDEWFKKHAEFKEMVDIGGDYEDKELAAICNKIINFLSIKSENPLLTKQKLVIGFREIVFKKLPSVGQLLGKRLVYYRLFYIGKMIWIFFLDRYNTISEISNHLRKSRRIYRENLLYYSSKICFSVFDGKIYTDDLGSTKYKPKRSNLGVQRQSGQ